MPPQETLKYPEAGVAQSLWGPGSCCSQGFVEPSKHLWQVWGLILITILPLLPSCCPLPLDVGFHFLVGSNILLSMVVQQRVVILEFSFGKMSAHPSTLPSCVSLETCCWASLIVQSVKNLPAIQEFRVRFLGREDPLKKEMATYSNVIAWRIPWTE